MRICLKVWRGVSNTMLATDDFGENQDEGDGGQQDGLRAFAHIAYGLRKHDGNQKVDDCSCDFCSESIENLLNTVADG